jgi:hypothetical protein
LFISILHEKQIFIASLIFLLLFGTIPSIQPSRDDWVGGITPDEDPDAEKESDLSYGELCDYYGGKWKKFDRKDSWYDGDCQFKGKEAREDYKDVLCNYHSKDIPEICMGEKKKKMMMIMIK